MLSGCAAQGLVSQLQALLQSQTGFTVQGNFGAVGLMKDRLLAGDPCDVLILTQARIAQLTRSGELVAGTAHALGRVKTGVAVKSGEPSPLVDTPEALKKTLLAARGVYFPDPTKATAGVHFMNVLRQLGMDAAPSSRLRVFPNGAAAMREIS